MSMGMWPRSRPTAPSIRISINLTGQVGIGNWGTNNIVPKPTQVMDGVALSSSAVVPSVTPSEPTVAGFYDVYKTDYYADAVAWAKASSVTGGTSATTFSPETL